MNKFYMPAHQRGEVTHDVFFFGFNARDNINPK